MNLSPSISNVDVSVLAKQFIDNSVVHLSNSNVDFTYRISDDYVMIVSVFNEKRNDTIYTAKEYLDMLYEDLNEVELWFLDYNQYSKGIANIIQKADYPIDVFGLPSKKYLSLKDTSSFNKEFYTLDSIDYVMEYLCILYGYDVSLLETKDL